ncbi:MAG: Na+/H+ antiporter NhaC family protein, partial [candidate division Zixibacteria bacterium]|nr:Na+/H+ antiporter NhaC family protein [candidate division Zixibacteria bacterium]
MANIAIISTWIGYEISLISQSFDALGIDSNAYITFIQTIPYNFYPLYTLLFGLLVGLLQRDYGSMWRAEHRASTTGKVLRDNAIPLANLASDEIVADEKTPKRWYNALVPVLTVIIVVGIGLF